MDFIRGLLSIIFPPRMEEALVQSLSDKDVRSLIFPREIQGVTTLSNYNDTRVRALVWEAKYHKNEDALRKMGSMLHEHLASIKNATVVPIPLSEKRLAERGYNQIEEALRAGGVEIDTTLLVRVRETIPQTQLPRKRRLTNLSGAFDVPEGSRSRLRDLHIVLVDDVTTTGATLEEVRRTLSRLGARKITLLSFARS